MLANDLTREVKTVALNLMEGLSCPRSLTVAILIRASDWVGIAELSTDPLHYNSAEDLWAARAASDFLRKYVDLPTGIDRTANAIKTFNDGERECFKTNLRLNSYLDPAYADNDTRINDFFDRVRKEVRVLIGLKPPKTFNWAFGPGATISDNWRFTTVADKMSTVPTMTPNAWIHLPDWISTKWGQAQAALGNEISEVSGNTFFTVPKDATTDRGCGTEPSINVAAQLPVGRCMRQRMLFSGIDLQDGQSIHKQVACAASISGKIATIDLKNASGSIARVLVQLCFPPAWHDLLCSLRSPTTKMPKGTYESASNSSKDCYKRLEQFSAMGNGFTFEMETVLFCAIARAVCIDNDEWSEVSVYGDDILAPTSRFDDIVAALRFCGFTPNSKKTFGTGSFRESCGGDYFNGTAVRPFYLKEFNHEPQDYISLANGIRRMACEGPVNPDRWGRVRRAWFSCLDNIPVNIRSCRGPTELGDTVIHDDLERWSIKTTDSIRYVRSYTPVSTLRVRWEGFAYDVQFAVALYLAGSGRDRPTRDPDGNLVPRDPVTGYRVSWTPYS